MSKFNVMQPENGKPYVSTTAYEDEHVTVLVNASAAWSKPGITVSVKGARTNVFPADAAGAVQDAIATMAGAWDEITSMTKPVTPAAPKERKGKSKSGGFTPDSTGGFTPDATTHPDLVNVPAGTTGTLPGIGRVEVTDPKTGAYKVLATS